MSRHERLLLTDDERARSSRILFTAFPDGINLEEEIRKRQLATMHSPRSLVESGVNKASRKTGGLVFRAAIKAIHLYQSVSRRLAK